MQEQKAGGGNGSGGRLTARKVDQLSKGVQGAGGAESVSVEQKAQQRREGRRQRRLVMRKLQT
jgi:hypothetical protein